MLAYTKAWQLWTGAVSTFTAQQLSVQSGCQETFASESVATAFVSRPWSCPWFPRVAVALSRCRGQFPGAQPATRRSGALSPGFSSLSGCRGGAETGARPVQVSKISKDTNSMYSVPLQPISLAWYLLLKSGAGFRGRQTTEDGRQRQTAVALLPARESSAARRLQR